MGLVSVTEAEVVQVCAKCKKQMKIAVKDLVLGAKIPSRALPNTIRMPPCVCGAGESLFRQWDVTPPEALGTRHDLQRRAVNALAQLLRKLKQVVPEAAEEVAAETSDPPDMTTLPCTIPPA